MIVVDSSAWIDFFNGVVSKETSFLLMILGEREIMVGDLILSEVLQGFCTSASVKKARELLLRFEFREMVGGQIAEAAASNYRALRSKGLTVMSTIDTLIATFCIENDFTLLHSDREHLHFERHCGLKVVRT